MPRWERRVEIDATPARVWHVMSDVAKWPEWTPSIVSVDVVPEGLGPGGSAVVHAQGTPKSQWTVSRWEPGSGFDWTTSVRGARTVGGHWIEPAGTGKSKVVLSIDVKGLAAVLLKPVIGRTITRNMDMEAEGLKARSEAAD